MSKQFNVEFEESQTLKPKPDVNAVGFGREFTDYMLSAKYTSENGWSSFKIRPYQNLEISPACLGVHYGQSVFEGLKAYKNGDDVLLFRPDENFKRLNESAARMSMVDVPLEEALEALYELVRTERDWVPDGEGQSLYIRPLLFATDEFIGLAPSQEYEFHVILSPVGSYFGDQLSPTSLFVEDEYVRAVRGGAGFAKTSGNYGASFAAQKRANDLGYAQVMWLDGVEQKYVEEVGSMNVFFVKEGVLYTPKLNGSILPGITRKSVIEIAKHKGYEVREEKLSVDELAEDIRSGKVTEVFGSGTAVVVSPVGKLNIHGEELTVNDNQVGPVCQELYDELTSIQYGKKEDPFGWVVKL